MCRLFGMLSVEPYNARRYLLDDPCSLYAQSKADPKRLQGDGWGVGFYVNNVPTLVKSEKPIYTEHDRFTSVVDSISSEILVAHIRRASNPRGLPRENIISTEASQPFQYRRYTFAHNGVIYIPDEVMEVLGEWRLKVRSFNDSEVYFWYIVREMEEGGAGFRGAVESFQGALSVLWDGCREKHPNRDRPHGLLNVVFSDGERLYAYTKHDEGSTSSRSICFKNQPSAQMSYVYTPNRLIVASEKTNVDDLWQALGNEHLLTGWISGGAVNISVRKV